MSEGTKIFLDQEELAIQKKLRDGLSWEKTDLWPAVKAAVGRESASAGTGLRRNARISRRVALTAAALIAGLCLMGAGFMSSWFVYDSAGNQTKLTEAEGFAPGEGYAVMKPAADGEQLPAEELSYPYDWVENEALIPGGLQIPGKTAGEQNIPELREKLAHLPQGTLAEVRANGIGYAEVQGSFSTDYAACEAAVRNNALGIRLPDASLIPADYNERLSYTAGYYMTEPDYAAREELASEDAGRYALKTYTLPESVRSQVGWYALEWFRADKSPVICTAHLAETDEMLITTTDEKDTVRPLAIEGFDKALYWEHYNQAYDAQEISLMLWQEIEPVTVLELGYRSAPEAVEKRYVVYILDAVGLTEEEAVRIAEAW